MNFSHIPKFKILGRDKLVAFSRWLAPQHEVLHVRQFALVVVKENC
jgi:hypothetical protein